MSDTAHAPVTVPPVRLALGRGLLAVCALAALAAAVSAVPVVRDAAPDVRFVEAWRAYGFATFALLFLGLAVRPHASRWLWAAVLADKLALTLTATAWLSEADGARQALGWDGALTVLLLAAFVLTRAWTGPRAVPAAVPAARLAGGTIAG